LAAPEPLNVPALQKAHAEDEVTFSAPEAVPGEHGVHVSGKPFWG
jgi:hypothetical protein